MVNNDGVTGVRTDTAGEATAGGIEIRDMALGGLPSLSLPSMTGEAGSMGASAGDSATEVRGGSVGDEAEVLRTRDNMSAILHQTDNNQITVSIETGKMRTGVLFLALAGPRAASFFSE